MDDDFDILGSITITRDLPFTVKLARFFLWTVIIVLMLACILVSGLLVICLLYIAFTEHFIPSCVVAGIIVFLGLIYKAVEISEVHNINTGKYVERRESDADRLMRMRGDK